MLVTRMIRDRFPHKFAALTALAVVGCGGALPDPPETNRTATSTPSRVASKAEPAPTVSPHPQSPKPDATRLRYDVASRTLEVYEPPIPGGRWMLTTPKEPRGVPLEGLYQFPPMVNLDQFAVFYTGMNGKSSQPVSLREIVEARDFRPR